MNLLFHPRQMISNMASVFTAQEPNEELAIPQPIKTLAAFLQCNSFHLTRADVFLSCFVHHFSVMFCNSEIIKWLFGRCR